MKNVDRLAVYCGSAPGADPAFADAARATAAAMVRRTGRPRLRRRPARAHGPDRRQRARAWRRAFTASSRRRWSTSRSRTPSVTELHTVETMHERKAKMTELADAFLALPGGIGTLDELFEAWSWNALGYHKKPFCLLERRWLLGRHDRVHRPCDRKRVHVRAAAQAAARRLDSRGSAGIAGRSRRSRYAGHGLVRSFGLWGGARP